MSDDIDRVKAEVPDKQGYLPRFLLDDAPVSEVHAFWLAGLSCDGCSIAAVGAKNPTVEQLITGTIPGLPKVILHHPVLSVTAGDKFMQAYHDAKNGTLGAPYVVIQEGSVADEDIAGEFGGYWSAMGTETLPNGTHQPIPTAHWLRDLAQGAAAVIAMSVMDYLGKDYLSTLGLPPVNIPGCAPLGDNITETVASVLMFLAGVGPLPEFDELGRPAWMFQSTVHRGCVRAGNYEEGKFAEEYGEKECLVELGCWGPVVQCNMVSRGAIGHNGGCMNTGGICIGCTMPGFPDAFAPFYKKPPGTMVSSNISRSTGSFVSYLRKFTQDNQNLTSHWKKTNQVPSGWANVDGKRGIGKKAVGFFYERLKSIGTEFTPGSQRQKELQKSASRYLNQAATENKMAAE